MEQQQEEPNGHNMAKLYRTYFIISARGIDRNQNDFPPHKQHSE